MLRPRLVLANVLIGLGLLILLAITSVYAYGVYERYQFEAQLLAASASTPESDAASRTDAPNTGDQAAVRLQPAPTTEAERSKVEDRWQVEPIYREPPLSFPAPTRIVIPSINVDSKVVEAEIENGTWAVPKFVVGHLTGTAKVGEIGNMAFSGHVESISSGNIFARLGDVEIGDRITVYADDEVRQYRVTETKVVKNDDLSVVEPTEDERITLITCTGTWNFVTRDYSHRQIVIAQAEDTPAPPWTAQAS